MKLEDIKKDTQLINSIDWDMTPEEAVTLYLEWGNNWSHGKYVIRSKNDFSHYFVINTWGEKPQIYLIRRNSEDVQELAQFDLPEHLVNDFYDSVGCHKGVYAIEGSIKDWLKNQLDT
ncbi:hypothetical protein MHK_006477 [Candidatus Magnetomorum sp. HK-1]|nr:hypothetical protein MHK_006477 [Candidatus Magnetomorum sp. HK-1]